MVAALALLLAAAGCRRDAGPPGVVVVVLDAAGARHLGAYGNALPTSPRIDALARDGVVFERAYAQAPWTLPSTASLLTGRYPPGTNQRRLVIEGDTLATRLRAIGVRTAAFSENPLVTEGFGFAAGFEVFRSYFRKDVFDAAPRHYRRVASETTIDDAVAWLAAHRTEPFFLYLHLLPPHCPYDAPAPFGGRFDADYAGEVRGSPDTLLRINEGLLRIAPRDLAHLRHEYQENLAFADHQVGRLLDALDRLGVAGRALVVVTGDHGEAFGEHGVMLHSTTLYEEMVHVPLVVRFPAHVRPPRRRWPGVVELRHVTSTVAHAFGAPPAPGGRPDLLAVLERRTRPVAARVWTSEGEGPRGALVTERYKLILDRRARRLALYDLERDPLETADLAATRRRLAVRLARRLRRPGAAGAFGQRTRALDPETVRRLRALGYVDTP